ncbi:zinc finger c-x8-C-x5-C-x3-H type (and similar) domain-containing protein [Sarocladium implicatum]|nr:zinc finger c-x8-C-x5-C-x3-H type (and similar) domain-containing protein [Sarocladium implicatum]
MFDDNDLDRAARELTAYRNDAALNRILDSYSTLLEDFQRLKSDYEEEHNARERYKQIAKRQDRKPFVLVLVDGDGYIFHESLIKQGAEGGRKAAQALDESVKFSLRGKGLEHCDVMVRIYANVAGLSKALAKAGLVGHDARSLSPFVANFNRSFGLYDFVDAGDLKEGADFKLRTTLRFYADVPSCRQIYFAACHDVGYISELTPLMSDKSRFTLLETPSVRFHDEFKKLNISIEQFRGVFRTTPIDFAAPQTYNKAATIAAPSPKISELPTPISKSSAKPSATVCSFYLKGWCKNGSDCHFAHTGAAPSNKATPNWRDQMRSKMGSIEDLPLKNEIPANRIVINAEGHRLDPQLSDGSIDVAKQLRTRSKRICNEHHLLGQCKNGPDCDYDHTPLNPGLLDGVEALSRSILCSRKGNCRQVDCIKGHVCQLQNCMKRGGKDFCRLPATEHTLSYVPTDYVEGTGLPIRNGTYTDSTPSLVDDEDALHSAANPLGLDSLALSVLGRAIAEARTDWRAEKDSWGETN